MKSKLACSPSPTGRPGRSYWILLWPAFGLLGLLFAGQQLYPRLAALHWKSQLADASESQVEVLLDRIAGLDQAGISVLAEALSSEREVVARGAKQRLLSRIVVWKTLPVENNLLRLQILADALADRIQTFGPAARHDASELAMQILLTPCAAENSAARSQLLVSCGEVLETTSAGGGETTLTASRAKPAKPADEQTAFASAELLQFDTAKSAANVDPLPGGGLPIVAEPKEKSETKTVLPGENRDVPPAYFQEPSNSRSMDFSNRSASVLKIPEGNSQNAKNNSAKKDTTIKSMSLEDENNSPDSESLNLRGLATLELMRGLAEAEGEQAKQLRAELTRRGLSAVEIGLARQLFDTDPAVRKKLVAELPSMPGIDASAWLVQCCRDSDADVRLEAFSILATSRNPILLQKIKNLAGNDSDSRIQQLAERIGEGKKK